jgi:hypothetical protein
MRLIASWVMAAALGGLLGIESLTAQWPAQIVAGARVRARLPEAQYQRGTGRGHLLRGRIAGLAPDTLYLAITDSVGPLAIPRHLIQRLDYSRGVPSRLQSGLIRGLLGGAGFALAMVLLNDQGDDGTSDETAALIGGIVGFTTGATLGAIFPTERWKSVRLRMTIPRSAW